MRTSTWKSWHNKYPGAALLPADSSSILFLLLFFDFWFWFCGFFVSFWSGHWISLQFPFSLRWPEFLYLGTHQPNSGFLYHNHQRLLISECLPDISLTFNSYLCSAPVRKYQLLDWTWQRSQRRSSKCNCFSLVEIVCPRAGGGYVGMTENEVWIRAIRNLTLSNFFSDD